MRRSSRASGEWTSAWNEPDGAPSASPRSSRTPAPYSPSDGPTSRTSETSPAYATTAPGPQQPFGVEVSHVRIYRSPASGRVSAVSDPYSPSPSSTLWSDIDLQPSSWRTSPASSPAMPVETLGASSVRWGTSGTGGPTGYSTLSGSECPSDGEGCSCLLSTLADILTPTALPRFSLSARAAAGIIRRSERRGRTLPVDLRDALLRSAGTPPPSSDDGTPPEESRRLSPPGTTSHLTPSSAAIRRLTLVECERLMGWPEGWTIAKGWKRSSKASALRLTRTTRAGGPET